MTGGSEILLLVGVFIAMMVVIAVGVVALWSRGRATRSHPVFPVATNQDIAPWVLEGRQLFTLWEERIERLNELKSRLAGMAEEIDKLRAEVANIDEMRAQLTRLGEEGERCRTERDHLRGVLARLASIAQEAAARPST